MWHQCLLHKHISCKLIFLACRNYYSTKLSSSLLTWGSWQVLGQFIEKVMPMTCVSPKISSMIHLCVVGSLVSKLEILKLLKKLLFLKLDVLCFCLHIHDIDLVNGCYLEFCALLNVFNHIFVLWESFALDSCIVHYTRFEL